MLKSIKRKIEKIKSKKYLNEYGFHINSFSLENEGVVEYAQWEHPYEGKKEISQGMINFYKKYSRKGSLAIDIGAHTGDTSVPMAVALGQNGTLLALEPNQYVYKILVKNAELNKTKTNIIPLNIAATEEDGEFEFNYSDASFCNGGFFDKIQNKNHKHKYILKVKGVNLENYLKQNHSGILNTLSLVKVDAEGYDKEIIKNMYPLLLEYKPFIISECNKNLTPEERKELFDLLDGLGYALNKIDEFNEDFTTTSINNASEMNTWKHFDLVAIPKS